MILPYAPAHAPVTAPRTTCSADRGRGRTKGVHRLLMIARTSSLDATSVHHVLCLVAFAPSRCRLLSTCGWRASGQVMVSRNPGRSVSSQSIAGPDTWPSSSALAYSTLSINAFSKTTRYELLSSRGSASSDRRGTATARLFGEASTGSCKISGLPVGDPRTAGHPLRGLWWGAPRRPSIRLRSAPSPRQRAAGQPHPWRASPPIHCAHCAAVCFSRPPTRPTTSSLPLGHAPLCSLLLLGRTPQSAGYAAGLDAVGERPAAPRRCHIGPTCERRSVEWPRRRPRPARDSSLRRSLLTVHRLVPRAMFGMGRAAAPPPPLPAPDCVCRPGTAMPGSGCGPLPAGSGSGRVCLPRSATRRGTPGGSPVT